MSRQRKPLVVGSQKTRDDLGRWSLLNDAGTRVSKYSIVRLSSTKVGGAYHKFVPAIADGTQEQAQLLVLWADSPDDTELATASERYLLADVDTSSATLGALVYLSDTVAGAWTLTTTNEPIGRVTRVDATDGLIWIDPVWAKLASVSALSGKSRPDWDASWEARISGSDGGDGDNDVYVNNSTGSDVSGDGTPDNPYASLDGAILRIPHNRNKQALRNVTIHLANTGTAYDIHTNVEALTQLTIVGDLPTATVSTTVSSVTLNSNDTLNYYTLAATYTGVDQYRGWLVRHAGSNLGWCSYTDDDSGSARIVSTQSVNGAAYAALNVSDAIELWDPADLVEIRSTNTGGNGTNLSQLDNLKIRYCNLSSSGTKGKWVFYQSRATLQDCYVGDTVGRILANNGTLVLTNCYIATDGEAGFGQVGVSGGGVLQLRGGTTFDADSATGDKTPVAATGRSSLTTSGPIAFRGCKAILLTFGARCDYADGQDANVSWYFYNHVAAQPLVTIPEADGAPVTGTIPRLNGDPFDASSAQLIEAKAPVQLWFDIGNIVLQSIPALGPSHPVSVDAGVSQSSGQAYDGSFIRRNRARSGSLSGPYVLVAVNVAGSKDQAIDFSYGLEQVVDFRTNNLATKTIYWYLQQPSLGGWHTLYIQNDTSPNWDWSNVPVRWAGGTAPTPTSDGDDLLRFFYTGTEWIGEAVALGVS